ncbi:TPA: glycine betaine/L-proline ABC transporter substrate-binding protein ProX [Salmonella enterica subsp. enterica serovar Typhimurium]|nr:glycine betaine/L-proline ABC transporter substrate-binding protein ProX [Salmonella enterica subsp. enterica serovar Typhimurium]
MADQTNPWDTAQVADTTTQTADAWGTPAGVATDGGSTDWLNSAPAPAPEHFSLLDPFHKTLIPLDSWVTEGIDWVVTHFRPLFQGIRVPVDYILNGFQQLLLGMPAPVAIILFALIAWQVSGVGMGIATLISLIAIGAIGAWSQAMITLALVLTALLFCVVIGLPMGIWLARSPRAAKIVRPLLDAMQTTPAFVYLVPIVMLFGIGNVPGVVVTIIFALPPIVRLTILGINQVPADLIEASRSFGASAFAADLPGKGITVQPIQSTISEETFQTLLVSRALEKLGYTVNKPSEVDYNVGYTSIASGDATFTAVNWQPLHDDMYAAAGGDNKFYREGVFVSGAAQGYLIDKKTAEQYNITNIAQLKDPKIAKIFDTNGDGKADMMGCSPGWGCEAVINHQNKAFDLQKTVEVSHGNYAAMMADTITRFKEGKPVLYYTWTPYWVSDVMKPGKDVVWLQVPFSSLPGEQKNIDTKLPNGANYGFPVNTMHIVANKAWAEKNPAAAKLFAIMKLPLADINAQNAMMHAGKSSEADVQGHVDGWINAHQQQFDGWVKEALAAQK